jgi:hypothetical protein
VVAEFSASDAAFTGFRVVAQRPWIVAVWAFLQLVSALGFNLFMAYSAGPALAKLDQLGVPQPGQDLAPEFDLFRQVAPTYIVVLLGSMVLNAVLYAAMNRAVLKPTESRFGYLRLAADELRQLGLFAIFLGLGIIAYAVLIIVSAVVIVILGLATGGAGTAALGLGLAILLPVVICAVVFVAVRLSLASPMTFDTHRIDPLAAWRMTRGRFWPMLGAYVIGFVLSALVVLLTLAIARAAVAVVGGVGALPAGLQVDLSSVAAVVTPPRLAFLVVNAIGQALIWPVTMTPPAAIYRALRPSSASRAFD